MRSHQRTILLTLAIVIAAALSRPAGQRPDAREPAERGWTHPRTPWGDPDLEGVWTTDDNFAIPLERPVEVADKVFLDGKELEEALGARARTIDTVATGGAVGAGPPHWYENLTARSRRSSLIIDPPDGRLPGFTPGARQRAAAAEAARSGRGPADSSEDRSLWDRCIAVGLPFVMFPTGYNNNVRILQTQGYVTITHEMIHDTRIVPLDGRPHLSPAIRQYTGRLTGPLERQHAGDRRHQLPPEHHGFPPDRELPRVRRDAAPDRALHSNRPRSDALRSDHRRPRHLRTTVHGGARPETAGKHL